MNYVYEVRKEIKRELVNSHSFNKRRGDYYKVVYNTYYHITRSDGHNFTKFSGNYAAWKKKVKKEGHKIILIKE